MEHRTKPSRSHNRRYEDETVAVDIVSLAGLARQFAA
jgi:hypothetical protein